MDGNYPKSKKKNTKKPYKSTKTEMIGCKIQS
jgi:hypothetical protein